MSNPDTPETTGQRVREEASRAGERLADDARRAGGNIEAEARDRAERAKDGVAGEVSGIAGALRSAADQARDGSPQERSFGLLADSLADASEAIADRDLGQMAEEASSFARRNPLVFLGGAALAGFAATRFVMASAERPRGNLPAKTDTVGAPDVPARTGTRGDV